MPKDEELRVEIIWLHYDVPVAGYRRRQKIIELVLRNYWWPEVTRDIRKYVNSCDICQNKKQNKDISKKVEIK